MKGKTDRRQIPDYDKGERVRSVRMGIAVCYCQRTTGERLARTVRIEHPPLFVAGT